MGRSPETMKRSPVFVQLIME